MSLTDKCGIIMAFLTDPLSQIISKISSGKVYNAIGVYYFVSMTKQNRILSQLQ